MGHRVRHGAAADLPRSSIGGFNMDHETIGGIHPLSENQIFLGLWRSNHHHWYFLRFSSLQSAYLSLRSFVWSVDSHFICRFCAAANQCPLCGRIPDECPAWVCQNKSEYVL